MPKPKKLPEADTSEPKIEYLPVEDLPPHPENPKRHALAEIKASFARFGFVELPVRDETTGTIAAGHGRREALLEMKAAGAEPPKRIRVDDDGRWLVPVVTGIAFKDERELRAYLVASNRLPELGGWSDDALADVLLKLKGDSAEFLDGVGWTEGEIDAFVQSLKPDPPKPPKPPKAEAQGASKLTHTCPACGHEWQSAS